MWGESTVHPALKAARAARAGGGDARSVRAARARQCVLHGVVSGAAALALALLALQALRAADIFKVEVRIAPGQRLDEYQARLAARGAGWRESAASIPWRVLGRQRAAAAQEELAVAEDAEQALVDGLAMPDEAMGRLEFESANEARAWAQEQTQAEEQEQEQEVLDDRVEEVLRVVEEAIEAEAPSQSESGSTAPRGHLLEQQHEEQREQESARSAFGGLSAAQLAHLVDASSQSLSRHTQEKRPAGRAGARFTAQRATAVRATTQQAAPSRSTGTAAASSAGAARAAAAAAPQAAGAVAAGAQWDDATALVADVDAEEEEEQTLEGPLVADSEVSASASSADSFQADTRRDPSEPSGSYDGISVVLLPQVELPKRPIVKAHNSDKNFWPWFKALSQKHKWQWVAPSGAPDARASLLFSKGAVPYLRRGKQMLNSIGVSGCIGGSKLLQLSCRERLAQKYGCAYDQLQIQPAQYDLNSLEGCLAWHAVASAPRNADKMWLWKPSFTYHGAGLRLFRGSSEIFTKMTGGCKQQREAVVMEYVEAPATMQSGYKFDLRTYLLVGSLDPQLVFFADGFVRKSDKPYNLSDTRTTVHVTNSVLQEKDNHFFSFDQMAANLADELGFGRDYIERMRDYMKRVSVFVFKTTEAQKKSLSRFPGRFHLFAVDWLIDAEGRVHLLEGNGYPLVTEYPVEGLTPKLWEDLVALVLKVHTAPIELGPKLTVKDGFKFGKWSLIYNELEEQFNQRAGRGAFNPCTEFPRQQALVDARTGL